MTPTRTIAFMNQKGGVGKTTTAVNLAAALAQAGRSVGVIDLDPQAHLSLHLGVNPQPGAVTVYDLLVDPEVSADDAWIQVRDHLYVLPAETDLAAAEVELAGADDRTQRLTVKLRLSQVARALEFILIDCPPSLGLLTLNALAVAREVMVPMQAHFLALQGVSKLLETVSLVSRQVNPDLQVTGIILCMYEGQTRLASEVVSDLEQYFESNRNTDLPWRSCRVLRPAIRRNIKLAESPSFGSSIFDYDANCPGAEDYRNLASTLMREWDRFLERRGSTSTATTATTTSKRHPASSDAALVKTTPVPAGRTSAQGTKPRTEPQPIPTIITTGNIAIDHVGPHLPTMPAPVVSSATQTPSGEGLSNE